MAGRVAVGLLGLAVVLVVALLPTRAPGAGEPTCAEERLVERPRPAPQAPLLRCAKARGWGDEGPRAGRLLLLGRPVELNLASYEELLALPSIGPATADAIVRDRARRGPYCGLSALSRVKGIGPARVRSLARYAVARAGCAR